MTRVTGDSGAATTDLAIGDVAARTGLAAGTIRMWEQRYGFPAPRRTPSGRRVYAPADVEAVRRVLAERDRGLSMPAAIERATAAAPAIDATASLYAAVAGADPGAAPQRLRKSTLVAISRAIEFEALAQGAPPVVFASFQRRRFYGAVQARYRRLARIADAAVVFADFDRVARPAGAPVEIPVPAGGRLQDEWALVVDAPGYCSCLVAWELPAEHEPSDAERRFEAVWTIDPHATRHAAVVAAGLAGAADAALGVQLAALLADRPLALEEPLPALTALTNRMVAELERARTGAP